MESIIKVKPYSWAKITLYSLLMLGIYFSALTRLIITDWAKDGFSYCYLIPFVVFYLLWIKKDDLAMLPSVPSWKGLAPILLGFALFWVGELSGVYLTLYYSMWLILVGLCWIHLGWEKLKSIGFALFFILTMFPPPQFFINKFMLQLRLISSKLAVSMIQLYGLSVTRQGNIIDLGFVQLQVVEACSGLYSLISLVVLCLLLVYFFKDHIWKRVVLLISAVPLAISTNSFRIALTAILHKHFGPDVAQGFFHIFSGLLIFAVCIPLLLIEMNILGRLPPIEKKLKQKKMSDDEDKTKNMDFDIAGQHRKNSKKSASRQAVFTVAVVFLAITLALSQSIEFREKIPAKKSMAQFPLEIDEWKANGRQKMAQKFLDILEISEYAILDYKNQAGENVNFYVAYYENQSKGKSIHTPATCLPGSGWSFDQSGKVDISIIPGNAETMGVNRAVIQYGRFKQIVYYWFSQRGRILNNAYQLKIYNFWDALIMQRTDGALVRLITPVYENEKLGDAEARLQNFVRDVVPVLEEYIPGKEIS